jgi:hypothetical protein
MDARAHGWQPPAGSKAARLSVSVAKDFVKADKKLSGAGISNHRVGEHDGSSAAMARGGSAFSSASRIKATAK